ncbi:hypothetical protein ACB098_12G150000 [Castanea mollissima]
MREVPSLISLCIHSLKKELIHGDDLVPVVFELPQELFDALVLRLPPLTLQNLQTQAPFEDRNYQEFTDDCFRNGRKRGRHWNFNTAWRALYKLRWPDLVEQIEPVDWQQMYWEMHLQNCLDEATEIALLPSFNGCIGDIRMPDAVLKYIGVDGQENHLTSDYLKLSYHCQAFVCYARCLILQQILCTAETSHLLRTGKLKSLVLRWIRSKEHSMQTHGIQHFSINASSFLEHNLFSLPVGLSSFLSSGRSLCSLNFCDNHLGRNFAKMVFNTILDVSSSISILDLSENNISGWLSDFNKRSSGGPLSSLGIGKSLQSLRVLNLRGSNLRKDDAESLRYALVHMPNLEDLDISDNSIEDEGIRNLIPYFVEATERCSSLAYLNLEDCDLSCNGVTQLLNTLSTFKGPLKSLSLADNCLGSQVAVALGKFLQTSIEVLNIGGIGLGSTGFQELQEGMTKELKLVKINISKNHGGIETAKFLSKLLSLAPKLGEVNAAYNFMPIESLSIICAALKVAKGNLERLDLTETTLDYQLAHASMLNGIQCNGRPIVTLPIRSAAEAPYDDDP